MDSNFKELQYLFSRYGFLSFNRKNKVIIFGGEKGKEMAPSLRDLTNDLIIYDYNE